MNTGQWESCVRIAGHIAATHPAPRLLTHQDRLDAALDAIIGHVHEHGWPHVDLKPVFLAGSAGVDRATWEAGKHLNHRRFWTEPAGADDALAEQVTDKVAIWQLMWALTDGEWESVWATAEVMKRGGHWRDGAALIGKNPSAFASLLSTARKRGRGLWIAPGDTPPRHYGLTTEAGTDYRTWRKQRRRAAA